MPVVDSRNGAPKITWPDGKRFAFTVIDDPDGNTEQARKFVYPLLADLGFRTTKAVWPIGPLRERNSDGETCADKEFREDAQRLQEKGFEIAYHNAAPHSCTRAEIVESLEAFRRYFGADPVVMANHYNADAIYWGQARLTGSLRRSLYNAMTRGQNRDRFRGQVEGDPHFWGDICSSRIRYCRNLVFRDVNTLRACPYMPYADPERPFVNEWFCASEGAEGPAFIDMVREENQDRLEAEGGLCIMYTHFGKGFVSDDKLNARFVELMKRLSVKNGWFVPVQSVLEYLTRGNGQRVITTDERSGLEWKWLKDKCFHGTS